VYFSSGRKALAPPPLAVHEAIVQMGMFKISVTYSKLAYFPITRESETEKTRTSEMRVWDLFPPPSSLSSVVRQEWD
jgi:hypothetical protein